MRFFTVLTALAAANFVACAPAASSAPPPESTATAPISANGCPEGTTPGSVIRVKDIDPGHAQADLVIGQVCTQESAPEKRDAKLQKRYWTSCYTGPIWVLQDQANRAISGVCTWMRDHENERPQYGREVSIKWDHYQDNSGTYVHIKDIYGNDKRGNWKLQAPLSLGYDWESCFNAFFELIWSCHGSNPDTAGGELYGYGLGWNSGISWYT
ncbi:hypothetical protein TWF281_004207 [Arthrobotrys megalospora]